MKDPRIFFQGNLSGQKIPWWTCPSCFAWHPDKTSLTGSGASSSQAPDSWMPMVSSPYNGPIIICVLPTFFRGLFSRVWGEKPPQPLKPLNLPQFLLYSTQFFETPIPPFSYLYLRKICKATCSPAPSLPSLLPELILLLSPCKDNQSRGLLEFVLIWRCGANVSAKQPKILCICSGWSLTGYKQWPQLFSFPLQLPPRAPYTASH